MSIERTTIPAVLAIALLVAAGTARAEDPPGSVPSFTGRDLSGKKVSIDKLLDEGPVALTFWATWCKPCRKELPELQVLAEAYAEHGFRVIAVSVDGPVDQAKVRPYARAQGFTFLVVPDPDGDLRRRFQVEVVPTTTLLGPERRVLHRQVGYRQGDEKRLEIALRNHLGLQQLEVETSR